MMGKRVLVLFFPFIYLFIFYKDNSPEGPDSKHQPAQQLNYSLILQSWSWHISSWLWHNYPNHLFLIKESLLYLSFVPSSPAFYWTGIWFDILEIDCPSSCTTLLVTPRLTPMTPWICHLLPWISSTIHVEGDFTSCIFTLFWLIP